MTLHARTLPAAIYYPLLALQGIAWIYAYVTLIHRGHVDKYLGIPVVAAALNLGWEITYAFVLPNPPGQKYVDVAWVVLDFFILRQAFLYGWRDYPNMNRRTYAWSLWGLVVWATLFQVVLGYELADFEGIYGSLGINVVMSLLYIRMLRQRGSSVGQSIHIAVSKCVGTLTAGLMFILFYPERLMMTLLTVTILAIDIVYIRLLAKQIRAENYSIWAFTRPVTPAPVPARAGRRQPVGGGGKGGGRA